MPIPKYDELYKDILTAVSGGQVVAIDTLRDAVAVLRGITPEERMEPLGDSGQTVYENRIAWARTYLRGAGLIDYPQRGTTQITADGTKVLEQNPAVIDNKFLKQFEAFRAFRSRTKEDVSEVTSDAQQDNATPAERISKAVNEINAALREEILQEIMRQEPVFFERLAAKLLEAMGYGAGKPTPLSGDGGIDGWNQGDELGFHKVYYQAKRWDPSHTIHSPDMQRFSGATRNRPGNCLFITTASFSSGALDCARQAHITTIDGKRLVDLMIKYNVGLREVQRYVLKGIDSDFFST